MTSQEIADIFAGIELELIGSLKVLLNVGKTVDYSSFKMQTLRSIEAYRKRNSDIWIAHLPMIEEETAAMLEDAYEEGVRDVQVYHDQVFPEGSVTQTFAGVNAWRMDSLIEDVNHNLRTAQTASLRMMEDVYRDVVYKAEIHHATGAITVRQAVDRAVKEFLERGINCIEYKDGRRVNIATYAEMALRTASLRSKLRGEAAKRRELGVDTVLVSQYGACSDTCLPWQGRVYIDDVWGDSTNLWIVDGRGQSLNGKWYPLLSEAVEGGLFHPNCRHSVTTWYEGVSRMPTPLDATAVRERSRLEQRQRELERKVRKWKRLEEGSQTPENVAKYKRRRLDAQKSLREFVRERDDVLRRDYWREKVYQPVAKSPKDDIIGAGVEDRYTRITKEHTIDSDTLLVNPRREENELFKNNCSNCSVAYEMRRRGYDVEAKGKFLASVSEWESMFEGFEPIHIQASTKRGAVSELIDGILALDEGARGGIFGIWDDAEIGHFFNFEVKDGRVIFIDAQEGIIDVRYPMHMRPDSLRYGRWDDLSPTGMITLACKNKE